MRLCERIKALREQHGWTQEKLGDVSKVRIATLSGMESGRNTDPRWSHLVRIARAFGMTVEDLLADVHDVAHRWPPGEVVRLASTPHRMG